MAYPTDFGPELAVPAQPTVAVSEWRAQLPLLRGRRVTLRALEFSDAPVLFAMLTAAEVTRFISPPPATVEGFERFIAWTHRQQSLGRVFCFGIVPHGQDAAVGLIQFRALDDTFSQAEWGFVMGAGYWGTGLFHESATLAIQFSFDAVGTERLEARASAANGRGNGALRKLGAVQEAVLRRSFLRGGEYHDQMLWGILKEEWDAARQANIVWRWRGH